jgi:hypothetical protein
MIDPKVQLVANLLEHNLGESHLKRALYGNPTLALKITDDIFKRTITLKGAEDTSFDFDIDQIIDGIKFFESGRHLSDNQKNKLINYVSDLSNELSKSFISTAYSSMSGRFSKINSILEDLNREE